MGLFSLVYTSLATRPMQDDDLRDILTVARTNNAALEITGMLLYKDGHFIQLLEGEENWVNVIYDKITQDSRHTNLYKVYARSARRRSFSKWTMGFNSLSALDPSDLPGFTDFLSKPFDPMFLVNKPDRAAYLLDYFKNRSVF